MDYDSKVIIQTEHWKFKAFIGVGVLCTLIVLAFMFRLEVGIFLGLAGTGGLVRLGFWVKRKVDEDKLIYRQLVAETSRQEHEAKAAEWRAKQERFTAQQIYTDSLFVERKAGTFVIGDMPFKFYPTATASAQLATAPALALPSGKLDFFTAMSNDEQVFAIVGPQRIGKSILAMHLAQYLTQRGSKCIVVGTKARPGEWLDCKRYIGNEAVPTALKSILVETIERLASNRTTPRLCVFLDDWLNSCALDSDTAEQFFVEAATRMLTAGIVPYFLLQSDSKADYGTKKGAQLKNNFVHLYLGAPRDDSGNLDRNQLRGFIFYPGDKNPHEVNLPRSLPMLGDAEPDFELAEPRPAEPTAQEKKVLGMFDGGASLNSIAKDYFKAETVGGKQYDAIRVILAKYGRNE